MKEHLYRARITGNIYRHQHMPAILGHKGFLVHLPQAEEAELVVGQETKELPKLLLETMPEGLISEALRQKILQAIELTNVPNPSNASLEAQTAMLQEVSQTPSRGYKAEKIQHYVPKLNLDRWNSYPLVLGNNNCYNYANDKITNSFAQPGRASGHPIGQVTPEELLQPSESDGLVKLDVGPDDPCPEAPEQPNCLVALFVDPGVDFHWYRLDDNGRWSQKPGPGPATNKDGHGNLITDPRKAANSKHGPDYKFVAFMMIFTNIMDGRKGPHPGTK
ncbi:uncharacterized protein LOC110062231 [Orbicella faveolata]|uniref:uncharacterized protein LOC110062231 n=1 Tax=Orbicella faveolata TaxID=48498 RepID=UPI0009E412E2|nr:uncharacterized protein LOC110062231 [Orbicella faveolata]XP_020624767.1 uncharacterized protein LOC110062231 [Orbicella faveolata]XP_020624768.1 uncharacterized protein LOC110062231 [Orbicella faveolata]